MAAAEHPYTLRHFSTLADYDACMALQDETWGQGFAERVPGAILRVAQKVGGVAAGAFDDDGRLMGFAFGMTGPQHGTLVHWSDMLAVRPEARGTGVAAALKQFQRDAVLQVGAHLMLWTADPLVARNAHFNINHLGAVPAEYVENMYGANTGSVLHGAMPTDRAVYHWQLDHAAAFVKRSGLPAAGDEQLPVSITFEPDGTPVAIGTGDATQVRIPIPVDLTQVQATSAERALAWRIAVRAAFVTRLDRGYVVTRFVRGHDTALPYYVVSATS
jgi:predicted GNAT superfamily acetyltransferase